MAKKPTKKTAVKKAAAKKAPAAGKAEMQWALLGTSPAVHAQGKPQKMAVRFEKPGNTGTHSLNFTVLGTCFDFGPPANMTVKVEKIKNQKGKPGLRLTLEG